MCLQYYTDEDRGSQSLDIDDGAPPVMSKGSYSNLYNASSADELRLGDSAHSLKTLPLSRSNQGISSDPRGLTGGGGGLIIGGHVKNPPPSSAAERYASLTTQQYQHQAGGVRPSPGLAQRATAAPVSLLPSALSPTKVTSALPLPSDAKYPTTHALHNDRREHSPVRTASAVSPSAFTGHKSNSTGSLGTGSRPPRSALVPQTRQSPTFPPQPPVSYFPQGGGGQREFSMHPAPHLPPRQDSNRKSGKKYRESGYSSSATATSHSSRPPHKHVTSSRVPPSSLSASVPQAAAFIGAASGGGGEISNVPGAVRRPMSFVKALEMADHLQTRERQGYHNSNNSSSKTTAPQQHSRSHAHAPNVRYAPSGADSNAQADDSQHFGSSYEISV